MLFILELIYVIFPIYLLPFIHIWQFIYMYMMDLCLEEMKSKNKKSDEETNSLNSTGDNDDDEYTDSNFGKVIIREKITKI